MAQVPKQSTRLRSGSGAILALGLALLQGCGGGGGASAPPPQPLQTLAGVYKTLNNDGSQNSYTLIIGTGPYTFRSLVLEPNLPTPAKAGQVVGTFTLPPGGTALSGSGTVLLPQGTSITQVGPNPLTGTANTSGLNITLPGDEAGQVTPDPTTTALTFDAGVLAGTYASTSATNATENPPGILLTPASPTAPNNALTFTDTNATPALTGTITQVSAGSNAFTITATFNYPGSTPGSPLTRFTGLGYAIPVAGTARYTLIVMLDNGNGFSLAGIYN